MTRSRIVVVGAGLGGLASAIRLQASGHAVTLVEKRAQLGGRAAQLKAGGYTFDMGPSIITAPHLLHDLWSSAGGQLDDDVDLVPLAPYYRICFADGRYFDYGGTTEEVEAQLRAFDPNAVEGYHRFMSATRNIYRRAFEDLAGQPFHWLTTFLKLVPELLRLNAAQSVYDFVSRFFRDPQLRTVFSFHPLFIGGNPFRASAIYSIVPYLERQGGVWFARGGTYAVVEAMHALFTRLGGRTRLSTGVAEVIVDDVTRQAIGVRLDTGESLAADAVVLNADVATAYMRMVPPRYRRNMTDRHLRSYRYSMSCFLLYLGLDRQYAKLLHHTIVMAPRYRGLIHDIFDGRGLPPDMSLYLHAPTKTDPSMAPPGGESLYVLVPVPHLGHGVDWTREAGPFRDRIVHFLDMRVSLHPGQYTVLSSPDERIIDAARADLVFHARLLDSLGLDLRHKIVIHVGGAYGDKAAALDRWCTAVRDLPDHVRGRLVLENDERLFGAEDVLAASRATGVPVVLDILHHRVYAGGDADAALPDLMRTVARTWQAARDGVPKTHYSSQAAGLRPGAHADYVDTDEFERFLHLTPDDVEFDCMLEAKCKDLALFRVRDALGIAA